MIAVLLDQLGLDIAFEVIDGLGQSARRKGERYLAVTALLLLRLPDLLLFLFS